MLTLQLITLHTNEQSDKLMYYIFSNILFIFSPKLLGNINEFFDYLQTP